ncbi:MAG: helix-turn-helix domain-containing protein [Actinomycetota bacterium]
MAAPSLPEPTSSRPSRPRVGALLRTWRERRHLSQLQLAARAEVSTRHLSYVETGRSMPSRELLQHLAAHLDVPHRERNDLLVAAGYAPAHLSLDLDDPAMASVRAALDAILVGNAGHPTLVMDRWWNLVDANEAAAEWIEIVPPHLTTPPINVLRATLHPDGFAAAIENIDEVQGHLLDRLRRQVARTADAASIELLAELESLTEAVDPPGGEDSVERLRRPDGSRVEPLDAPANEPAMPIVMHIGGKRVRYLSVVSTFGSPLDVTAAELTIETFYAVD